jgi:hypothetical protein
MAIVLGLRVGKTLYHLGVDNVQDVAEQIRNAMASGEPMILPLANNGLLVLRADGLTDAPLYSVYVPEPPPAVPPSAPLQPVVASGEPDRAIM